MIIFVLDGPLSRYPSAGAPAAHLLRSTRVDQGPVFGVKGPRRGFWLAWCGLEALSWRDVAEKTASERGEIRTLDEIQGVPLRRCLRCGSAVRESLKEWNALEDWRR